MARGATGAGAEGIIAARTPLNLAGEIASIPFAAAGQALAAGLRAAKRVPSFGLGPVAPPTGPRPPFIITPQEIRPMTQEEQEEREPIQAGRPLFPARRTQFQPEGTDIGRIREQWSTPEGIAMLASGNVSRLLGYTALASMVPGLVNDAKTIASSSTTDEEKRDRINNLFALAGMVAGHGFKRYPNAPDYQNELAPLQLTGAEVPGMPPGFSPLRAVAGPERLGPPIPPARVRSMTEAQANLPGGEAVVTQPEAGIEENQLQTIRRLGLKTKEEVLDALPALRQLPNPRERAAALLKEAQGPIGPPLPPGAAPPPGRRVGVGVTTGPLQGPDQVVAGTRPVIEPMRVAQEPVFQGPQIPPEVQAQREREANMQREIEARRSALQQMIIFWERELEMAQNRGDNRAQEEAAGQLMLFRREYESIPPVKEIRPKPPIQRAPGSKFRPEVPETPAETDRETVASTVKKENIKTIEGLLDRYPQMKGTGGSREWARSILLQVWGAFPPGVMQGPPLPPTQQPPPEEPPAAPPGAPVPKPSGAPPAAPGAAPAPEVPAAPTEEPPPPTPETPPPPTAPTIEDTVIAGKTLGEWEAIRDASQLPKGNARAELASWLAVPNQPSRILQALGNKRRTREIHAPPAAEVAPVAPEAPQSQEASVTVAAPEPPTPPAAPEAPAAPAPPTTPVEATAAGANRWEVRTPAGKKKVINLDPDKYEARLGSVYERDSGKLVGKIIRQVDLPGVQPVEEAPAAGMKPEVFAKVAQILASIEDNQTSVRALEQLRSLKNADQLTIDQFADLEKKVAKLRIEGIRKFNPAAAHFEEQKPAMDAIMEQVGKGPGRQIAETGAFTDPYRYVTDALNAAQRRKVLELAKDTGWRYVSEGDVDPSYGRGLKTLSFKPPVAKKPAPVTKAQKEITKVAQAEGQRPAKEVKAELLKELQDAITEAPTEEEAFNAAIKKAGYNVPTDAKKYADLKSRINKDKQIGKVTIDIPGDGVFKVLNTKEALTEVLDRAKAISTAPGGPVKVTRRTVTKEQSAEYAKEAEELAKGKPSMGPGAAASAEFEEGTMPPPDPAVYGLSAGNRWFNERVREFQNMVEGFAQLGQGRGLSKKRIIQSLNTARTLPAVLGNQAGNSFRLRLKNVLEQRAVTALMQAFKMSGEGLEEDDLARLQKNPKFKDYVGDPMGYLRANQTDLETYAQEKKNKGRKLEAQAAIDLAQGMQYARDHFADLKPVAEQARRVLDAQLKSEEVRGIDTEYERWYVPQLHDLDLLPAAHRPIVLADSKGVGPSSQFRKPKFYEDYSSAIQAGRIPRSLSIADLIEHRVRTGEGLAANKALFESLKRARDPIDRRAIIMDIPKRKIRRPDGTVDVREAVPLEYAPYEVMPGMRVAVHKGYERMIRALTGAGATSESAVIAAAQNLAGFEKHIGLALDTFHFVRTLVTEFVTTGKASLFGSRLQKGTSLLEYDLGDLDRAVQQGQITQATVDWIKTPQQWNVHGRDVFMTPRAVINYAIKGGLNLGRIADAIYKDWIRELPVIGDAQKIVFDKITRSAMVHGFLTKFRSIAAQHPEWTADQVARNVASDINVLFGNLQKESWIRSPSLNAVMNVLFLAPNWVQSRIRSEVRGVSQIGYGLYEAAKGYEKGGTISHVPRIGTAGQVVGTGLAGSFILAQLVNLITRGHLTFQNDEPEHKLDAYIPDPYGNGFFFSPLAMFAEIAHDILRYHYTKSDWVAVADQIIKNKLGNLGRMVWTVASHRDPFTDQKIIGSPQLLASAFSQALPVPIVGSAILRAAAGKVAPGLTRETTGTDVERQALSSFGVKVEPAGSAQSEVRRMVDRWKLTQEPKLQADVERRLKEDFGTSGYTDLRQALSRGEANQAQRAYQALRAEGKTPKQIRQTIRHPHPFAGSRVLEHRFRDSLTQAQQKVYDEALREREVIAEQFDQLLENKPQLTE